MNLAPLLPAAAILSTHLVLVVLGSKKHWVIEGKLIYRYPRGIAYFILVGCLALTCFMAFMPGSRAIDSRTGMYVLLATASFGTLSFIYIYWYRVILGKFAIRTGVFFLNEAAYVDIVRARYIPGQNSGQIILYTRFSKRIHVWQTIGDFGSCANEINARLPAGVTIPREGRMSLYLKDPDSDLTAKVAGAAEHLRTQLDSERHKLHGQ